MRVSLVKRLWYDKLIETLSSKNVEVSAHTYYVFRDPFTVISVYNRKNVWNCLSERLLSGS
ncbi:MAG: hypothetical protein LM590_05010 [Thermofilum sp.]|nr:hypothetical protein [Thermofilum sp.]